MIKQRGRSCNFYLEKSSLLGLMKTLMWAFGIKGGIGMYTAFHDHLSKDTFSLIFPKQQKHSPASSSFDQSTNSTHKALVRNLSFGDSPRMKSN